jgi:predicted nucleotidyltransferase
MDRFKILRSQIIVLAAIVIEVYQKSYLHLMKLSSEEIKAIQDYFQDKPVLKAFIFGSFSREEALGNSDIDILVELDYTKHIGLGFIKMKFDLEDKLHKKVDLVSSNAILKYILPFINNDKVLIYER